MDEINAQDVHTKEEFATYCRSHPRYGLNDSRVQNLALRLTLEGVKLPAQTMRLLCAALTPQSKKGNG